jgi:hypothetical protein
MLRKSAKAKGRNLQKVVAEIIQKKFGLESRDVVSTPASVVGEDLLLSKKAKKAFPYSVEIKNQERLNIYKAIEQSKSNAGNRIPLVIFKRNRDEIYVCFELKRFLEMV